jgi:hypothetical protein
MIKIKFLARKVLYYFSPLNTFMGKGKEPEPESDPDPSGCGSGRPKTIRILPIRIRNTASDTVESKGRQPADEAELNKIHKKGITG